MSVRWSELRRATVMSLAAMAVVALGCRGAEGTEEARGDIVAILDDDAAPHPKWLARIRDQAA